VEILLKLLRGYRGPKSQDMGHMRELCSIVRSCYPDGGSVALSMERDQKMIICNKLESSGTGGAMTYM
jgi:hypothetical protein